MQQVLSKIKASLEESKNRIESGNHESHDLLPSLLLILVELLEENSKKYEQFIDTQKQLLTEEGSQRRIDYATLISDSTEVKGDIKKINKEFLEDQKATIESESKDRIQFFENLDQKIKNFHEDQKSIIETENKERSQRYLSLISKQEGMIQELINRERISKIIIYVLLGLILIVNIVLVILFIIK